MLVYQKTTILLERNSFLAGMNINQYHLTTNRLSSVNDLDRSEKL